MNDLLNRISNLEMGPKAAIFAGIVIFIIWVGGYILSFFTFIPSIVKILAMVGLIGFVGLKIFRRNL